MELRLHQQTAFEAVQQAYEQGKGRALVVAPTGWGKTVLFAHVIAWDQARHQQPVLVLAHRDELLQQAADKIRAVLPHAHIGKVGGGIQEWDAAITVASVQTVYRECYLKQLRQRHYSLAICDEAHHMGVVVDERGTPIPGKGNSYQRVVEALPDAFWLGVTATPQRLDGHKITGFLGEPVYHSDIIEMIEQGWLVDIRAIAVRTQTNLDGVKKQAGDYNLKDLAERIDSPLRNRCVVEAYLEHAQGRQFLCFSVDVAHAQHLADAFQQEGVNAAWLSGTTPMQERRCILADYSCGRIQGICNCNLLSEGFDDPLGIADDGTIAYTSCIVMARPTQSQTLFIQALGRGVRLAPGTDKRDCLLLDLTDNVLKHSLAPQNLASALGIPTPREGETLLETVQRKKRQQHAHRFLERVTREGKRSEDVLITLRTRLDWRAGNHGMLVLEVGTTRHRIALVPGPQPGHYEVWARLAPRFEAQLWLPASPLSWAQQYAEREARKLLSDPGAVALVDRHAAWRARNDPPTDKQVAILRKLGRPIPATKQEAFDLIGLVFAQRDAERAAQRQA
jgi:superfamily II DNA or RNA helicase